MAGFWAQDSELGSELPAHCDQVAPGTRTWGCREAAGTPGALRLTDKGREAEPRPRAAPSSLCLPGTGRAPLPSLPCGQLAP